MKIRPGTLYGDCNTMRVAMYWPDGNVIRLHHERVSRDMYETLVEMVKLNERSVKQYFGEQVCKSNSKTGYQW